MKITKKIIKESLNFTPTATDLFILIGPPSIGKTTWLHENVPDAYVISGDEVTEAIADQNKMSYDDMYAYPPQPTLKSGERNPEYNPDEVHPRFGKIIDQGILWKTWMPKAYEKVNALEIQALEKLEQVKKDAKLANKPIVIDTTNMNVGGRKRIIDQMMQLTETDLRKIGVVFEFAGYEEDIKQLAKTRNTLRQLCGKGPKTIPDEAYDRMMGSYEPPAKGEFDHVVIVDNRDKIKDFTNYNLKRITSLISGHG